MLPCSLGISFPSRLLSNIIFHHQENIHTNIVYETSQTVVVPYGWFDD